MEYIFHFVKDLDTFENNMDSIRIPYQDISLKRMKANMRGNKTTAKDGTAIQTLKDECKPHSKGTKPTTLLTFDLSNAIRGLNHPAAYHPQLPSFFIK
jgi:hypothetical protein